MIKLFRDIIVPDTGGPTNPIPQEVRDKIEAEAKLGSNARTYPCHPGDIHFRAFISGGSFGYSLALPTIEAQEERIRVLEEALEKAVGVIKQWHQADDVWNIYLNHSPEMKPIREALTTKTNKP